MFTYKLAISNFINGDNKQGGAYGFKLNCIDKLMEMRMQVSK